MGHHEELRNEISQSIFYFVLFLNALCKYMGHHEILQSINLLSNQKQI
jgi:hypothetical protein